MEDIARRKSKEITTLSAPSLRFVLFTRAGQRFAKKSDPRSFKSTHTHTKAGLETIKKRGRAEGVSYRDMPTLVV
jgi:hypothetical protein